MTRIAFGRGSTAAHAASSPGQIGSSTSGGAPWPRYRVGMRSVLMATMSTRRARRFRGSGLRPFGLAGDRRSARRVRHRDELDAGSLLVRLRIEVHERVDLKGHVLGHADPELTELLDLERVVVRPLARAELRREPLGVS